MTGTLYFLRFERPIGSEKHSAQFYIGYCKAGRDVEERLAEHRAGRGAKITAEVARQGIAMELVATMPGTQHDERALKNRHNPRKIVERLLAGTLRFHNAYCARIYVVE